jgi:two-component system sensor histidine kinase UhpB
MTQSLKILHLEDLPSDADMVMRELKKAGITGEIFLADNKEDFIKALIEFSPDIILSDHSLPSFNSHEALKIVKEMGIEIPFILITATVSEEYAVNIIKEGASDYILKDRLQRLPNAIVAALDKYNLELARRRDMDTLRSSERKYKLLFESNPLPMWMVSRSTLDIIDVNEAAITHYGYTKEEFLKINSVNLRPEEDIAEYRMNNRKKNSGLYKSGLWRHKKKDGTVIMVDVIAHDVLYENKQVRLILANDVTEKMYAEAELARQRTRQQKLITETSIQVQEREREEIGKELHDNINQILAAAKLYLQHGIRKTDCDSEILQKSLENIDLAIAEIRKLSQVLVAPSLGDITLTQAIEQLILLIENTTSLKMTLDSGNFNEDALDRNVKLTLYRIVQEQINNILKHSRATSASIRLGLVSKDIFLSIKDDGIGFDTTKNSGGIGLRNIANRVDFYDGVVQIVSSSGNGCTLEVTIPAIKKKKDQPAVKAERN